MWVASAHVSAQDCTERNIFDFPTSVASLTNIQFIVNKQKRSQRVRTHGKLGDPIQRQFQALNFFSSIECNTFWLGFFSALSVTA